MDFKTGPSLFLVKTDDKTTSTFLVNGEDHYTIGFRVKNIEAFRNYLIELGAKVGNMIDEGNIGKLFTFYDPFGNMFDVHQPVKEDTMPYIQFKDLLIVAAHQECPGVPRQNNL